MNWKKCKCKKWMIAKLFLVEWLQANDTEEESTTTTTATCKPSVYFLESCAAGRNVTRETSNDCCDSCAEAYGQFHVTTDTTQKKKSSYSENLVITKVLYSTHITCHGFKGNIQI